MLILRRKVGEKIVIGDGIVVVVTRVSGARVTLGIEAPPAVHIVRGELRPFDELAEKPDVSEQPSDDASHGSETPGEPSALLAAPISMGPVGTVTAVAHHLPR